MAAYTKANGKMTRERAKDLKFSQMELSMLAFLKEIKLMEKGSTHGLMGKFMRENGPRVSNTASEFGKVKMATVTAASGKMGKLRDMASINGLTVTDTKANG